MNGIVAFEVDDPIPPSHPSLSNSLISEFCHYLSELRPPRHSGRRPADLFGQFPGSFGIVTCDIDLDCTQFTGCTL